MNTKGLLGVTCLVLVMLFAFSVSALDISVTKTEINGVEVFPDEPIHLDVVKGGQMTYSIEFTANDDSNDVEVRATVLAGEDDIEKVTQVFDIEEGRRYVRELTLNIPDKVEQDSYRLLVVVSDKSNDEVKESYNLFLDSPRHDLAVEDVIVHPFGKVQAGDYMFARVRVKNYGQKEENDVKVTLSVPELGLSSVTYIDSIRFDKEEDTEEMVLTIPACAVEKQYRMNVLVQYNDGRDTISKDGSLFVQKGTECQDAKESTASGTTGNVIVITGAKNQTATTAPSSQTSSTDASSTSASSGAKKVLEVILLILVALLVIVGLIIGFTKLRANSDE